MIQSSKLEPHKRYDYTKFTNIYDDFGSQNVYQAK